MLPTTCKDFPSRVLYTSKTGVLQCNFSQSFEQNEWLDSGYESANQCLFTGAKKNDTEGHVTIEKKIITNYICSTLKYFLHKFTDQNVPLLPIQTFSPWASG